MKIIVAIKRVPDPDQKIRLRTNGNGIDTEGLPFVINPFDAIALEEALRIRENLNDTVEIGAVGIGGMAYEMELRTALAMGADRAVRIDGSEQLDPWNVARILHAFVLRENPNLVLMGKQAIDDDSNQTGQFLAALLEWPQATFASRIVFAGDRVNVQRETDLGLQHVRISLPAVITADLRLNEPRYASLPGIMRARKKPIENISVTELAVTIEPRVTVLRLEAPKSRRAGVRVATIDEFIQKLRDEAKVF